jgi:hypothetical protein
MTDASLELEVRSRATAAGVVLTAIEVTDLAETLQRARERSDRLRTEIGEADEPATAFAVPWTDGA